jgi:hypothetical protein
MSNLFKDYTITKMNNYTKIKISFFQMAHVGSVTHSPVQHPLETCNQYCVIKFPLSTLVDPISPQKKKHIELWNAPTIN